MTIKQLPMYSREDWNGFAVYKFADKGNPYLRVSTVLDYVSAKEQEKWRTGKSKEEIRAIQDKGRIPGGKIHDAVHAYFQGNLPDIPTEMVPVWDRFIAFKEAHKLSMSLTEYPVAHEGLGYAGQLDWFGSFSSCSNALCCKPEYPALKDHPCILDWKTGRSAGGNASVQLAAYRAAFIEMNPLYVDLRTVVVHLPRTGEVARAYVTQHIPETTHKWACALDWFKFGNFYKLKKEGWPWLETKATEYLRKEWAS